MTTKKLLPLKQARALHKKILNQDIKNVNKFLDLYGKKALDDVVRQIKIDKK
jgi:hypothetical protein